MRGRNGNVTFGIRPSTTMIYFSERQSPRDFDKDLGSLTSSYPDIHTMSMYDTKLLDYITLRHSTHLNYRHADIRPGDYKTLIPQAMKFVQDLPTIVLKFGKDPKSLLELGIRYPW